MPIDQTGLNNLQAMFQPKSNLDVLREQRDGLWKKMNNSESSGENDSSKAKVNNHQLIVELQGTDKQIQQAVYEEENRKLELERLKREEAAGKNLREREKALAKHEGVLYNASMNKLLSAKGKSSQCQKMGGISCSLIQGVPVSSSEVDSSHNKTGLLNEIDRDLRESIQFGIGAAEVARRRQKNHRQEELEASNQKSDGNKQGKKKTKAVNLLV